MYIVSNFVKVTIPNYLSSLPIPNSFGGWFHLGVRDWLALIPPTVIIGGITYCSYQTIKTARVSGQINLIVRKDEKKVVDFIDIEDINFKKALCRCWRSEQWPLCDGTHATHNKMTGDNTGPVVIRPREEENKKE